MVRYFALKLFGKQIQKPQKQHWSPTIVIFLTLAP